jgi:hypothetical protein
MGGTVAAATLSVTFDRMSAGELQEGAEGR